MLHADGLGYRLGSGRWLLRGLDLTLRPGELHVLLGANGAGKSSLLRLLSGELPASEGQVLLNGRRIGDWPPAERARQRAVLPQGESLRFDFLAREVVALGRHAALRGRPAHEAALIDAALRSTDTLHLAGQPYPALSGGERQRVQLARVLVQLADPAIAGESRCLLFDEPTAALDLAHQHACLRLLREQAGRGLAVLAVLHDLNLAARYGDRISLLHEGRLIATGTPGETLQTANLRRAYGESLVFQPQQLGGRLQFHIDSREPPNVQATEPETPRL